MGNGGGENNKENREGPIKGKVDVFGEPERNQLT